MKLDSKWSNDNSVEPMWCPCSGNCGLTCGGACTGCKGTCTGSCWGSLLLHPSNEEY